MRLARCARRGARVCHRPSGRVLTGDEPAAEPLQRGVRAHGARARPAAAAGLVGPVAADRDDRLRRVPEARARQGADLGRHRARARHRHVQGGALGQEALRRGAGRARDRQGSRRRRRPLLGRGRVERRAHARVVGAAGRLLLRHLVRALAAHGQAARRAGRPHVDREIEGEGLRPDRHEGDLRRRRRRRRGEGRARGDRRLPQGPEGLRPPRRAHAQGRAARRPPRHGQDAARQGRRRRGRRALLLDLGLRVRRDVRRGRRGARARPLRAGSRHGPLHHLHRRARRARPRAPRRRA